MCRCLQVSTSGFYGWRKREEKIKDTQLRIMIRVIHQESRGTYGSPRITKALKKKGLRVGKNKVAAIMREENIQGIPKKRRWKKRGSPDKLSENLLNRDFYAPAPNEIWVGDITQVSTKDGWLYVAVILDLFSRKVVGLAIDNHMRSDLSLRALKQAIILRKPSPGLIHHTDQGSQYTCSAYVSKLSQAGLRSSMSRAGDCLDNAVAESFFGTLKTELTHRYRWESREEASQQIKDFIYQFYNSHRIHSTNGDLSPNEAETNFYNSIKSEVA